MDKEIKPIKLKSNKNVKLFYDKEDRKELFKHFLQKYKQSKICLNQEKAEIES